ncbi:MAG TPA: HIT family protein [Pseudomonadales bacterium]
MDDTTFELHPRLAADARPIGDLALSRALLMDDRRFRWVILVPRLPGLRELHDLPPTHRLALFGEVEAVSRALLDHCGARKINVGALGNLVPQLHVHVVGREPGDAAWPGPVWGFGTGQPYPDDELQPLLERLRTLLVP